METLTCKWMNKSNKLSLLIPEYFHKFAMLFHIFFQRYFSKIIYQIASFMPKIGIHGQLYIILYIDGLMQERHNSSALAMELRLSCTNPSI